MTNQKWTLRLLFFFSLLALIVMLLNYIVDPFQHYRVSTWYKITEKKQREMTAGLAKNFPYYETAIVGSSMAENFRASYVNEVLNTTTLKLNMSGMTAHEMYSIVQTVLHDNKNIKNIIIALDINNFTGDKTRIRTNKFPTYLYDNDVLNDVFYLLNKDTIRFSVRALKAKGKATDFDALWYTAPRYEYSKKAALSRYTPGDYGPKFNTQDYQSEKIIDSFNYNLLGFIKEYPNVNFTIFYPPYSFLIYKDIQNKGWLKEAFAFKRHLINLNLPNLEVYDFQCVSQITSNLELYRDIAHYEPSINDYMIQSFTTKEHLQTEENMETCFKIIRQSATKEL